MKVLIPSVLLSFLSVLLLFSSISSVAADSDGEKSYKKHWALSIGDAVGTLEITDNTTKEQLKNSALTLEQVSASYPDIDKARLGKAVNDDGKYFLVWNLISFDSDVKSMSIYVLDAGDGKLLTDPIIKEGGSCGDKEKLKHSGEHA